MTEPEKHITGYKLFEMKKGRPGELFTFYVPADPDSPLGHNESAKMGLWLPAKIGKTNERGKTIGKNGDLAPRPGWHATIFPAAAHIGAKNNARDPFPSWRPDNQIWAEVLIAADVDWQEEANRRASRTKDGRIIARTAQIADQIPEGGFYRYKTNPNMLGEWLIAGAIKILRVLADGEVAEINKKFNVSDLPRKRPLNFAEWGFDKNGLPKSQRKGLKMR